MVWGNIEVKNELDIGGKAPNLQQAGYFTKLRARDQTNAAGVSSRSQMLSGFWCNLERFQSLHFDPLTEPLSLPYIPHRTNAIEKVTRMLHAMDVTVKTLSAQSKKLSAHLRIYILISTPN